jgi:hypothetical protein
LMLQQLRRWQHRCGSCLLGWSTSASDWCEQYHRKGLSPQFPTDVLQQLQQLTHLELACVEQLASDGDSLPLQPLQALTRLVHLRLQGAERDNIMVTANMLSGAHLITQLEVDYAAFEPLCWLAGPCCSTCR